MKYKLKVENQEIEEIVGKIQSGLIAANVKASDIEESEMLVITVRSSENNFLGGIAGRLWGECLDITYLWLSEGVRGYGLGKALLKKIEAIAQEKYCRLICVDTFSFQALKFYLNQGYKTQYEHGGYPNGVKKYFLSKTLSYSNSECFDDN